MAKHIAHTAAHSVAVAAGTPISTPKRMGRPRKVVKDGNNVVDMAGVPQPTAKTVKLIDGVRAPFLAFKEQTTSWLAGRKELAPKFTKAFAAYHIDTGLGFVPFVRLIDPSLPVDQKGYANHPSYNAAMYLKRLSDLAAKPKDETTVSADKKPATPMVALARLVATVLPLIDPDEVIWHAFLKECHWTDEQGERLQTLAQREKAIPISGQRMGAIRRRLTA